VTLPNQPKVLAVAIGAGAGVLSGLFGVGGGFVLVPAFTGLLSLTQRRASGTSLVAVIPISAAAAAGYAFDRQVDLFVAAILVFGGLLGAEVGTRLLDRLSIRVIRLAFAALLVAAAARLVIGPSTSGRMHFGPATDAALFGLGCFTGLLSGLLGVGGGFIMVPGMVLLASMPTALAKGTSLAAIIPTAMFATVRNVRRGHADVRLGLLVGCTGAVTALVASRMFVGLNPKTSNVLLGVLLLVLAGSMAYKGIVTTDEDNVTSEVAS
jgi:uncharacterized protein